MVQQRLAVDGQEWLMTCVSMGNPHAITFGLADGSGLRVDDLDLARIGPMFEHNPVFPARTNTGEGRVGGVEVSRRRALLRLLPTQTSPSPHTRPRSHLPSNIHPTAACAEFVEVLTRSHVRMHVWERGAGRTLACGTGACATVVAGVLVGRTERACQVDLPGGPLHIEWREGDNRIYMTGPAELVFEGSVRVA